MDEGRGRAAAVALATSMVDRSLEEDPLSQFQSACEVLLEAVEKRTRAPSSSRWAGVRDELGILHELAGLAKDTFDDAGLSD